MSRRDRFLIGAGVSIAVASGLRIPLWLMGYTGVVIDNAALLTLAAGVACVAWRAAGLGRVRVDGVFWMSAFVAWAALRFYAEGSLSSTASLPLFYPVGVVCFYLLCIQVFTEEEAQWARRVLRFSMLAGATLASALWIQPGMGLLVGTATIVRMQDFFIDINSASYIATVGLAFLAVELRRKLTAPRLLLWAPVFVMFVCVPLLNATRGAAVLIVAELALFLGFVTWRREGTLAARLLVAGGLVAGSSLVYGLIGGTNVVDLLYTRFTGDQFYGYAFTAARAEDAAVAMELWLRNPIIGVGARALADYRYIAGNHNFLVAVLSTTGLVGLALLIAGCVSLSGGWRSAWSYEGLALGLFVAVTLSLAPMEWYFGFIFAELRLSYALANHGAPDPAIAALGGEVSTPAPG